MIEDIINELIEEIIEKSYTPNSYVGVSNMKVVNLDDVIQIIRDKLN